MVGREGPAVVVQVVHRRLVGLLQRPHVDFAGQPVGLAQVARGAGRHHVFPGSAPALGARDDVIEGQVVPAAAVLALEAIAQEDVEAGEGGVPRRLHIVLERDHAGQEHLEARALDHPVVVLHHMHAFKKDRLDGVLPGPQRQWIIAERTVVGVQHQRGTRLRRHMDRHLRLPEPESSAVIASIVYADCDRPVKRLMQSEVRRLPRQVVPA